jgi:hypothetical protein
MEARALGRNSVHAIELVPRQPRRLKR